MAWEFCWLETIFKVGDLVLTTYKAKMYAVVTKVEPRYYSLQDNGFRGNYTSESHPNSKRIGDIITYEKVANMDFSPFRKYTGGGDEGWLMKVDKDYFDNLKKVVKELEGRINE